MTYTYSNDGFGDRDGIALISPIELRREAPPNDGFGDRDGIALAQDRAEGTNGMTFRQVFTEMLTNNSMCVIYYKEQIAPCDDIHKAFSDAWTSLIGSDIEIDDEDTYRLSINDLGHAIEIRLI